MLQVPVSLKNIQATLVCVTTSGFGTTGLECLNLWELGGDSGGEVLQWHALHTCKTSNSPKRLRVKSYTCFSLTLCSCSNLALLLTCCQAHLHWQVWHWTCTSRALPAGPWRDPHRTLPKAFQRHVGVYRDDAVGGNGGSDT